MKCDWPIRAIRVVRGSSRFPFLAPWREQSLLHSEPAGAAGVCLLMGRCRTKAERSRLNAESALARALAPEEIRAGEFVAVLYVISEWPSFFWDGDSALRPHDELVRICSTPSGESQPLKVRAVCLPFVLAKTPAGVQQTLDVRRCRLARLDRRYARAAWRAVKRRSKGKRGGRRLLDLLDG